MNIMEEESDIIEKDSTQYEETKPTAATPAAIPANDADEASSVSNVNI